jgi:uncharacterized membrane protein
MRERAAMTRRQELFYFWTIVTLAGFLWVAMTVAGLWFVLPSALICAVIGALIAQSKNQRVLLGAAFGFGLQLIGVFIVALMQKAEAAAPEGAKGPAHPNDPPALEVARRRYASGEISRDEFKQIETDLAQPAMQR